MKGQIEMNEKTKASLMAGGALGLLMIVTGVGGAVVRVAGCCNCLWPIAAGAFAVFLYVKKSPTPLQMADGAILGLIAGIVGGLINLLIGLPLSYAINSAVIAAQFEQLHRSGIDLPFSGFVLVFVGGIIGLVVCAVLALIGGIIGIPIFEKRKGGNGAPPPPPQNYGGGGGQPGGGFGGGGGYGGSGGGGYAPPPRGGPSNPGGGYGGGAGS